MAASPVRSRGQAQRKQAQAAAPSGAASTWSPLAVAVCAVAAGLVVALTAQHAAGGGTAGQQPKARQRASLLEKLGLEKVLVLRVPRAMSRSAGLIRDAEKLGLPLDFLNATDGLRNEAFRSQVLPLSLPEGTCADLVGAIFDSHEHAWTIAANSSRPVLVLEDDVRLPADFPSAFKKRLQAVPDGYHMAFVGVSVTPNARRLSSLLSRPDAEDVNKQALLGFWAYVVTPKGAERLLHLASRARRKDKRLFQPVDLFVAHRLKQLEVFTFEPTPDLAKEFEERPDRHHVLSTMRQVGIVTLSNETKSLNVPEEDAEAAELQRLLDKTVKHGNSREFEKSWKAAWKALRMMRRFSCWSAATLLQNAGLSLVNILQSSAAGPAVFGGGNQTLLAAIEAFASSIRYSEGTWMERKKLEEYPAWARHALHSRGTNGLPDLAPPGGWAERVPLPCGGYLEPQTPRLVESRRGCSARGDPPRAADEI